MDFNNEAIVKNYYYFMDPINMDILTKYKIDVFYFYTAPNHKAISGRIVPPGAEFVEIILDGEVLFHCNGKMQTFGRGSIFWHEQDEYTVHISVPGHAYSCICFQFLARFPRIVPRISRWQDLSTLDSFLAQVVEMRNAPQCNIAFLEQYCRGMLQWQAALGAYKSSQTDYPFSLRRLLEIMRDTLTDSLSIEDLARLSGMSSQNIHLLFRKYMKTSPHQYLNELRLSYAETLMGKSNLSIKEISLQCGFDHIEVFYRLFRKKHGMTPLDYRNKKRDCIS